MSIFKLNKKQQQKQHKFHERESRGTELSSKSIKA
jgi:hypothetical protein